METSMQVRTRARSHRKMRLAQALLLGACLILSASAQESEGTDIDTNEEDTTVADVEALLEELTPALNQNSSVPLLEVDVGGPYSGVNGENITFSGSFSFLNTQNPLSEVVLTWDFGDGTIITGTELTNPEYLYLTPGQYTVCLSGVEQQTQTASAESCTNATIRSRTNPDGELPVLVADIGGPYGGRQFVPITFDASNSIVEPNGNEPVLYIWAFRTTLLEFFVDDAAIPTTTTTAVTVAPTTSPVVPSNPTDTIPTGSVLPTAPPAASPAVSPNASPATSPVASPVASPAASPAANPATSPAASPSASPVLTTLPAPSPAASPEASPAASPVESPAPEASPGTIDPVTGQPIPANSPAETPAIAPPPTPTVRVPSASSTLSTWDQVELNQASALQDSKSGLNAPLATKPKDTGKDKDEEKDRRRRRATSQKQQEADAELIKLLQAATRALILNPSFNATTNNLVVTDGPIAQKTYMEPGLYRACLLIKAGEFQSEANCTNVRVFARPQVPVAVSFPQDSETDQYEGVVAQPISFNGSESWDPENRTLSYMWLFGDEDMGQPVVPTKAVMQHAYKYPGEYTACLIVNDGELSSAPSCSNVLVTDQTKFGIGRNLIKNGNFNQGRKHWQEFGNNRYKIVTNGCKFGAQCLRARNNSGAYQDMEVNQVRQRSMRFEGWTSTILSVEPLLNRPLFRVQLVLADNSTEQIIVEPPILAEENVGAGVWIKSVKEFTPKDAVKSAVVYLVQTNINGPALSIFDNVSLREL